MFYCRNIEGIDAVKRIIPQDMQYLSRFTEILEISYRKEYDIEKCDYIKNIECIVSDRCGRYSIKLYFYNVKGDFGFDINNGFYGALTIEECSEWGYEKDYAFRISSSEQNLCFEMYCEKIKAEIMS